MEVEAYTVVEDGLILDVEAHGESAHCPRCGTLSYHLHQNHWHLVRDLPISHYQKTWLRVNRRQFKCAACGTPFGEDGNVLDLWNRQNRWDLLSSAFPMVLEPICCPRCHTTDVVKHGKSAEGKQRYRCRNAECTRASFILNYSYRGYLPEVKQQIADMAVNVSGIRDTARVLKVSPTTVIEELKKTSPA